MPNPLNLAQTANDYTDAATISFIYNSPGGTFDISMASVYYQLQYLGKGMEEWTPETIARPGAGVLSPPAVGVRFRSAVAGAPATVSAFMAAESQPFAVVAATASANAGITGVIDTNGAILEGSGFTVVRNSAGRYTVTFSPALSGVPAVNVTILNAANYEAPFMLALPTAAGFQAGFNLTAGPTAADAQWNFTAVVAQ